MADPALNTDLAPYPVPTPRPTPPVSAPKPVPPQNPSLGQLAQNQQTAETALEGGYQKSADMTRQLGQDQAAYSATQADTIGGLHGREEQELRGLDQGPFQPKQDTLASMGSLFMLVGMVGAFMGGKGTSSAAANAQAALTGIIGGWNKGDEQEAARQKAVFDTNSAYLKDKAEKVRDIYKSLYEDAKNGDLPGAISAAHQKLLIEGNDVNAQVLVNKGLEAGVKNAESQYKAAMAADEKKQALDMHFQEASQAHMDRLAAIDSRNQNQKRFTPEMGELMAALAEKGVSLPTGLRSQQQQSALYSGLLERHPGKTPDQIADMIKGGQIDLKAELKETNVAAGIAGRVDVAAAEIPPMGDLVLQAAQKVPRGSFLPINKLLRTTGTQLQDPNLRDLQVKINSLLNAYDVLAARGGTDVLKREAAHKLLTDADSPENLAAGIQAFKQEVTIAGQAAYSASHKYGGGEGGPAEGEKSTSKSGKPITFKAGKWVYD